MKILAIGDVTSAAGVAHLCRELWRVRERFGIDMCVVNGENADFINGISPQAAEELLRSGADVITGGNHTMAARGAQEALFESGLVLRPLNYGDSAPGAGSVIVDTGRWRVLIMNAMGNVHMEPNLNSPYPYIDKVLAESVGKYDISILDFHAEATGEKLALGYNYDGKINVVFGTHTHVPTADLLILPQGTGYVSDLGMCGESMGVLGMEPESVIVKMKTRLPSKFRIAKGAPEADGVIFELDNKTLKAIRVERIKF